MEALGLRIVAVLLAAPAFTAPVPRRHAGPPSALQAAELISRAQEREDLRSQGSEPLRLTARISVMSVDERKSTGTYTLLWMSPRKWREEISLPGFTQVRMLVGDTLWRERVPAKIPYAVFELQRSLEFRSWLRYKPGRTFSGFHTRKKHRTRESCFAVHYTGRNSGKLCFDRDSGELRSVKCLARTIRFSDFASWGSKLYPRTITVIEGRRRIAQSWVQEVGKLTAPPVGAFSPPPHASSVQGCQDPLPPKELRTLLPRYPHYAKWERLTGTVRVLAKIGVNGTIDGDYVLDSPDKIFEKPVLKALSTWTYQPASCGGVPVPAEIEIDVNFDIR